MYRYKKGKLYFRYGTMGSAKTAMLLTTAYNWYPIDEAQFLSTAQVDQLSRIVDDFGSNVICYGLRTDFQSHLFEGSKRLFEIADTIDEIKSTCNCGNKTIINARIDSNGDIVEEGAQVEIGGDERYVAVCRKCWRNKRITVAQRSALPLFQHEQDDETI